MTILISIAIVWLLCAWTAMMDARACSPELHGKSRCNICWFFRVPDPLPQARIIKDYEVK